MPVSGFVRRAGQQLTLNEERYRVAGGNTYYLGYVPEATQDAVFDLAQSFGMNALRIWAFFDRPTVPGPFDVCFQYWDAQKNAPVINPGPNGLDRLDRAVSKAGERGLRLILTLTNNWPDFGGMPQYVQWFGLDPKEMKNQFYTDARCLMAYRNWVQQIVSRYRDSPAVLAWELANEPRCESHGGVDTLLGWVGEMSKFIRGLDPNHLIAVGDEGYFRHHFAFGNALYNGQYGVSCEELLGIGAIDFGTVHLYPESMCKNENPVDFGLRWIREHVEAAQRANKPMLIEEYGLGDPQERDAVFTTWLQSIEQLDAIGDMLWMLGLPKGPNQPYAPDQYVVSSVADAPSIRAHARIIDASL